eukprot:scaffold1832_cov362-Prasinococcus_capsulatus_cf.AAC.9
MKLAPSKHRDRRGSSTDGMARLSRAHSMAAFTCTILAPRLLRLAYCSPWKALSTKKASEESSVSGVSTATLAPRERSSSINLPCLPSASANRTVCPSHGRSLPLISAVLRTPGRPSSARRWGRSALDPARAATGTLRSASPAGTHLTSEGRPGAQARPCTARRCARARTTRDARGALFLSRRGRAGDAGASALAARERAREGGPSSGSLFAHALDRAQWIRWYEMGRHVYVSEGPEPGRGGRARGRSRFGGGLPNGSAALGAGTDESDSSLIQ